MLVGDVRVKKTTLFRLFEFSFSKRFAVSNLSSKKIGMYVTTGVGLPHPILFLPIIFVS